MNSITPNMTMLSRAERAQNLRIYPKPTPIVAQHVLSRRTIKSATNKAVRRIKFQGLNAISFHHPFPIRVSIFGIMKHITMLSVLVYFSAALVGCGSEGNLSTAGTMSDREMVKWLHEIIYTAQETIGEIETSQQLHQDPVLRIVEKPVVLERAE